MVQKKTKTSIFLNTPIRFSNSAKVKNSFFDEVKWEWQYTEATEVVKDIY